MKKVITLKPSYATTNTVRFDEDGTSESTGGFLQSAKVNGSLGKPFVQYLDADQLNALGWQPATVGIEYETEPNRRGQTYRRMDVTGPSLKLTIETL